MVHYRKALTGNTLIYYQMHSPDNLNFSAEGSALAASMARRDNQSVWHPFTPLSDITKVISLISAKGVYLHTADGRKIIDAIASWWVNLHGHGNEYIAQAIYEQARQLEHVIFAGFTHEPAIRLAERLLAILPDNQRKIFYSDNGSTAVEVALKMAFQYWYNKGTPRKKVIALDGAYHGDTFGAMSVGERSPFTAPFFPHLFAVEFMPFPACREAACCAGTEMRHAACPSTQSLIQAFTRLIQSGEVAAFIYEPLVQGAAGMRMYAAGLLNELLRIARQHGVLCIADEVMTGFGRTGKLFASEFCPEKPDIICLSKGITGGAMALGVTSCTEEVISAYRTSDWLKTFFHGHSFTANPLACAAANASLDLLLSPECEADIQRISQAHVRFRDQLAGHPAVREVRCQGVIMALEFNTESATSYFNEVRHPLYEYFLSKNILLRPLGNVIYLLPPYIITDEELGTIYEAIRQLLDKFTGYETN
jgi:adenosylmethionine---8-amino-7-oxononanoate aminotransferase